MLTATPVPLALTSQWTNLQKSTYLSKPLFLRQIERLHYTRPWTFDDGIFPAYANPLSCTWSLSLAETGVMDSHSFFFLVENHPWYTQLNVDFAPCGEV